MHRWQDYFSRQICLSEMGVDNQQRLQQAHILLVGAGGLGNPAALYLAGCGIGRLTVIDHDVIALHNLPRQILYDPAQCQQSKVAVMQEKLMVQFPFTQIFTENRPLDSHAGHELIPQIDLVIDGSDNFLTKYLLDHLCALYKKPFLSASVVGWQGYVGGYCGQNSVRYRQVFPIAQDMVGNCAQNGVMAPICGMMGSLLALEAIKIILNFENSLMARLLSYDGLQARTYVMNTQFAREVPLMNDNLKVKTIFPHEYIAISEKLLPIDVREEAEYQDLPPLPGSVLLPLSVLMQSWQAVLNEQKGPFLMVCHAGVRARHAALQLYELSGGEIHDFVILEGGLSQMVAHNLYPQTVR